MSANHASYFAASPQRLRLFQMLGATLWTTYGIALGEAPVIVANLLVLGAATWASVRSTRAGTIAAPPSEA